MKPVINSIKIEWSKYGCMGNWVPPILRLYRKLPVNICLTGLFENEAWKKTWYRETRRWIAWHVNSAYDTVRKLLLSSIHFKQARWSLQDRQQTVFILKKFKKSVGFLLQVNPVCVICQKRIETKVLLFPLLKELLTFLGNRDHNSFHFAVGLAWTLAIFQGPKISNKSRKLNSNRNLTTCNI